MFINPKDTIENISIPEDGVIADFGFGNGIFLDFLIKKVNQGGVVYAIDIQDGLIEKKKNELIEKNIENVVFLSTNLEEKKSTKISEDSVDFILISSVLFQSEKKEAILKEAKRIIKETGQILIIEWKDYFSGIGPAKNLILSEKKLLGMIEKNNLIVEKNIDVGDYHYGMIVRKK